MKNITLTLALLLILSACSSGSSEVAQPVVITGTFNGTYQNNSGNDSGTITLDIFEGADQTVTGNIFIRPNGNSCLQNTNIASGTSNGFNVTIVSNSISETTEIFTTTTTERDAITNETINQTVSTSRTGTPGTTITTNGAGNSVTATTVASEETISGAINFQLSINGGTLSGSYFTDGDICDNDSGSGTITVSR